MDKYQLTLEEIGNVCMKIYNINNDLEKKFGIIVNEFEIKNNFLSMYKVDSFSNSGEVLFFYDLYRKYYSPTKPARCIFVPTCSQYAEEAITKYGVAKGVYLSIKRILRCNPFNKHGGYDPVK